MPSYTVTVATGSQWFAGTDDYVYLSLEGTVGCSERHLLDKPFYNDFERGAVSPAGRGTPAPRGCPAPAPAESGGLHRVRAVGHLPSRRLGPDPQGRGRWSLLRHLAGSLARRPEGLRQGCAFFKLSSPCAGAPERGSGTEVPAAIPGRPSFTSLSWGLAQAVVGKDGALWFWLTTSFQISSSFPHRY